MLCGFLLFHKPLFVARGDGNENIKLVTPFWSMLILWNLDYLDLNLSECSDCLEGKFVVQDNQESEVQIKNKHY